MNKCFLRWLFVIAAISLGVCLLCGCSETKGDVLLTDEDIADIKISSFPNGYHYEFTKAEDTQAIADYFSSLHLIRSFPENPNEYTGMTWVIEITYADGREQTIYHSVNMFVRSENSNWFKISYEEASRFDTLLSSIK